MKSQFCLRGRQVERPAYASSCTSSPHPRLPRLHITLLLLLGIARVMKGFVVSSSWCLHCVCHSGEMGKRRLEKSSLWLAFCFSVSVSPHSLLLLSGCRFFQPLLLHLLPQRFSGCQQQLPAGQRLGKHLNAFSCFASFPKEIVCLSASCLLPAACLMLPAPCCQFRHCG